MKSQSEMDERKKEFRAQRHQFIMEYYKMSVTDLDRHLKAGWQTIVIIGGAVAALAVGQDKLPVFFSADVALLLAYWGLWNVIDSNYWALRAIAFLANVEAIYFTEPDRKVFNPYIGRHPKHSLMDSLKYQFLAVSAFVTTIVGYYVWQFFFAVAHGKALSQTLKDMEFVQALLWVSPFLLTCVGFWYTFHTWYKRAADYHRFSTESPGPGMLLRRSAYRGVDLIFTGTADGILSGVTLQEPALAAVKEKLQWWDRYGAGVGAASVAAIAFVIIATLLVYVQH